MKLLITRIDLLAILGKVHSVVPLKPALPVLSHLLLEAVNDQLILSATDLTVSICASAKAKVEEEGAIVLPARKFFQLVRELITSHVEIHSSHSEVAHINAGSSHFKMNGMNHTEFSSFPSLEEGTSLMINNGILKEMLILSSFAAARDDNRQVLNGVLFQHCGNTATFVGTDGKRLSRVSTELSVLSLREEKMTKYILPLKAVEEIIKLINSKEESSKLTFLSDRMSIEVDNTLLITKLLTGQYPDIDRVIPKKSDTPILLHREELISLLRQVSLFTKDYSSAVRFTLMPGELYLSATSGDLGEGNAKMIVNYEGSKLNIAFHPNYFLDILRHSKDESIQLSVSDTYSPGLITDSTQAHFVLMPMRIESNHTLATAEKT